MLRGTVIKAYSGFYYIEADNEQWECRLRGKFRLTKQNVLPGDVVLIGKTGAKTGVIEEILPRTTVLERPPVANVDQVIIVFACAAPDPQTELLDRMLVQAETAGIKPIICFNKADLVDDSTVESLTRDYVKAGYPVLTTSVVLETGIDDLALCLKNHITVFAGPSGSGKSALLNALHTGLKLKTGQVSKKIGRGKHTTCHSELLKIEPGTMVVDSPGFSSLDIPEINKQNLAEMFPEFLSYVKDCKFNGCLHRAEPDCAVKQGVARNELSRERYKNYLLFLNELTFRERRY
jgi:ribosome biogenesis GTPase